MSAEKPPLPSADRDQPKGPSDARPFLYNPDLAVPLPDTGVPVPVQAGTPAETGGGSTASDGYWVHDAAGPSRYVAPAAERGKSVDPDPEKPAED